MCAGVFLFVLLLLLLSCQRASSGSHAVSVFLPSKLCSLAVWVLAVCSLMIVIIVILPVCCGLVSFVCQFCVRMSFISFARLCGTAFCSYVPACVLVLSFVSHIVP